jgi:uncharacterized membrane protein
MPRYLPYFILLGFTALWCTGIYIVPFIPNEKVTALLFALYRPVCHQLADHSFHIYGSPLAVCVRCTALYTAFLAGILLYPLLRSSTLSITSYRYFIILLAVPMIADVLASWISGYNSSITSRVVSGGLFGIGAALLLIPIYTEAFRQLISPHSPYSLSHKHGGQK